MKVDWSKHIVTVQESKFCTIHTIHIPNSGYHMVNFVNAAGIMAVSGDFGNWIFCRQFRPAYGQRVDPSYWDEKLQISSEQKSHHYDAEKTEAAIKRRLSEKDIDQLEYNYLRDLLVYTHESEIMYTVQAFNTLPRDYDYDTMIIEKSRHYWLDVVYEAFNEICSRIKKENDNE